MSRIRVDGLSSEFSHWRLRGSTCWARELATNASRDEKKEGKMRKVALGCAALAVTMWLAAPQVAQAQLDHYQCYKVRDTKVPAKFLKRKGLDQLNDQFGLSVVDVVKIQFLCNPVDKNGEGINDPNAHLVCYKTAKGQKFLKPRPVVEVSTQFQLNRVEPIKAQLLCVPSTKVILP
jgi:hypothetical protein